MANAKKNKSEVVKKKKRYHLSNKFPVETHRQAGSDHDVLHSSPSTRCVPPAHSFTSASYSDKQDWLPTVWHTQHPLRQASIT